MESHTHSPSFTVSLRGYDREEVDEYLDSLAEALGQVEEAEDQKRALRTHIGRLDSRIAELEQRIQADTPRTGAVLGERIGMLLRSAEETASDTINRAEVRAEELMAGARDKLSQAEEQARVTVSQSGEQARRIEASARAEANEIIADAELRANARTRQIEQWAEQVVSHTRAEEARMLEEHKARREEANAELRALAKQRDASAAKLVELREAIGQALGLIGASDLAIPTPPAVIAEPAPLDTPAPGTEGPGAGWNAVDAEATETRSADRDADRSNGTGASAPNGTGSNGTGSNGTGANGGGATGIGTSAAATGTTTTGTSVGEPVEEELQLPMPEGYLNAGRADDGAAHDDFDEELPWPVDPGGLRTGEMPGPRDQDEIDLSDDAAPTGESPIVDDEFWAEARAAHFRRG